MRVWSKREKIALSYRTKPLTRLDRHVIDVRLEIALGHANDVTREFDRTR